MKKAGLVIIALLLCLCLCGCFGTSSSAYTVDYSDAVGNMPQAAVSPSEAYIIESLKQSGSVLDVEAVTEDTDPAGILNTQRGYVACVYYSSAFVDQSEFSGESVVEKGFSCGGCVEIFANEQDALARNAYLATRDGGLLNSGSHTLIGTIIIRTSGKMSREQQIEFTNALVSVITTGKQPEAPGSSNGQAFTDGSGTDEILVWIPTNGGIKYHTHAECSNMIDPEEVTLSEAEALGFTPCQKCY